MWTDTHFPAAMRSLSPSTRRKAIELANRLTAEGEMTQHQAIHFGIQEARRLARQINNTREIGSIYASPRQ